MSDTLKYEDYQQNKWPEALTQIINEQKFEVFEKQIEISYDEQTYDEILEQILPENIKPPHGYETIGQIIHFNLKKEQIPYQHLIGQVIMDKCVNVKTVVNKTEKLHNVYRTPELSLMAGEHNYEAFVKEGTCTFQLNFEKVYWNTRNSVEREKCLQLINPDDTVLDIFCGVGPFAVRAAKKGCKVIANDLNPSCYEYLVKNAKKNNVDYNMIMYCEDARKMVNNFLDFNFLKQNDIHSDYHHFDHVYMNLPVLAIDFLDVFAGLLLKGDKTIWNENNLPIIHVYGFVRAKTENDCKELMIKRILKCLPKFQENDIIHFEHTKNINANMRLYRISFRLSKENALYSNADQDQQQHNIIQNQKQQIQQSSEFQQEQKHQLQNEKIQGSASKQNQEIQQISDQIEIEDINENQEYDDSEEQNLEKIVKKVKKE